MQRSRSSIKHELIPNALTTNIHKFFFSVTASREQDYTTLFPSYTLTRLLGRKKISLFNLLTVVLYVRKEIVFPFS